MFQLRQPRFIHSVEPTEDCQGLVESMINRVAMCTEGYPSTHAEGEFLFDDKLWTRCALEWQNTIHGQHFKVPGMFWNTKKQKVDFGKVTFWVQNGSMCQPRGIIWYSNMYGQTPNRGICTESFVTDKKQQQ